MKERLNLTVESETKKYLKIKAIEEGTSVSDLIERMVEKDKKQQDKPEEK